MSKENRAYIRFWYDDDNKASFVDIDITHCLKEKGFDIDNYHQDSNRVFDKVAFFTDKDIENYDNVGIA